MQIRTRVLTLVVILGSLSSTVRAQGVCQSSTEEALAGAVAQCLDEVFTRWIAEDSIPDAAVAVVDAGGIVWERTYGRVDTATIFSIQSMSKSFTALAVLMAVQDGLVDLDTPIAQYLPSFTVRTVYADDPERRITLRHLLAHRSGLTHEAPVGSNFDDRYDFAKHIASISDTWLQFPVGNRWSYSNLGYDLAAYILQVRSGMAFEAYVRAAVLDPLGMTGSSLDMEVIGATVNRAVGHASDGRRVPLPIPMIGAGGVYSNVRDMARYLQFHINEGVVDGRRLLRADLVEEMRTVQFAASGQRGGYALGLFRDPVSDSYNLYHSGGGYGFQSDMVVYPEKGVAVVLLTNLTGHEAGGWRLRAIPNELIERSDGPTPVADPGTERMTPLEEDDRRLEAVLGRYQRGGHDGFLIIREDEGIGLQPLGSEDSYPLTFFDDHGELVGMVGRVTEIRFMPPIRDDGRGAVSLVDRRLSNTYVHVYDFNDSQADPPGPNRSHWAAYVGAYELLRYGEPDESVEIAVRNGYLYFGERRCHEHATGLFFTHDGQALDLRSDRPSIGNIPLRFVGGGR